MTRERSIFLLLTDTETMLTRMIKSYTRQPYNHASIAFDAELTEVYSFGRKVVNNPFIGGFVREDLHSVIFEQATCAVYSLKVSQEEYRRMYRFIHAIAAQQEQYRYNFIGLFGVMFNTPIRRKYAFFCSQFVASVLMEGQVSDAAKDPSLVEPSELPYTANFELIFEGKIQDYRTNSISNRVRDLMTL